VAQKGFYNPAATEYDSPGRQLTPLQNPFNLGDFNTFAGQNAGALALIAGFIAVAAFALGVLAFMKLNSISRPFAWLSGQTEVGTDSLPALLRNVEKNAKDIDAVRAAVDLAAGKSRSHFGRVGLVRYDAFDGVAGQQSYSLCILNDENNGILLSNLVGANFSRSYAIEIAGGEAPRKLGEEESRALNLAMKSAGA
jgi:hypothetical protein